MIKLPKTKSGFCGFLNSSRVLVTLGIIALKATVFQAYGMQKFKDDPSFYDIRAGEVVSIDGFDFVLTSGSDESKETVIRELAVASLEVFKASIASPNRIFEIFGLEGNSDSENEKILVETKDEFPEIIKEVAKDFSLDQLKIIHNYFSNPLTAKFLGDLSRIGASIFDYLKYGFENYNSPPAKFPYSKILVGLEKMHEKMFELVVKYEPSVCHYMKSQKSNSNWDGLIPRETWSKIVRSEYGRYSVDKLRTAAERTNILYQITWKMYQDLLNKHPKAIVITNDFMGKHEAIYLTYDQRIAALTTARILPIMTRIYRNNGDNS